MVNEGTFMTIFIRGCDAIGDAIMSLPAVHNLMDYYQNARFILAAPASSLEVYRNISSIHGFLEHSAHFAFSKQIQFVKILRNYQPDIAFLMPGSFYTAFWTKLAKIRRIIGQKSDMRSLFLTHPVSIQGHSQHTSQSYLDILKSQNIPVPKTIPQFPVSSLDMTAADAFLQTHSLADSCFGIIHPFASTKDKSWPLERYVHLSELLLQEKNLPTVFLGAQKDLSQWETLPDQIRQTAFQAIGRFSLAQTAALIQKAQFFVGNNSGIMHLAAAVNTKVFCISGPSNLLMTKPLGDNHRILSVQKDCVPCSVKQQKRCPHKACLLTIQTEDVLQAICEDKDVVLP